MKYFLTLLCCSIVMFSCADDAVEYSLEESVEIEILPYVKSFEKAAISRGYDIDWGEFGVTIRLVDIESDAVGRCLTYTDGSREIELDKSFWYSQSDIDKEFVIYHELGHCILDRAHLDDADNRGRCVSIMHSSNDLCRNNYNQHTREAFLDELFL